MFFSEVVVRHAVCYDACSTESHAWLWGMQCVHTLTPGRSWHPPEVQTKAAFLGSRTLNALQTTLWQQWLFCLREPVLFCSAAPFGANKLLLVWARDQVQCNTQLGLSAHGGSLATCACLVQLQCPGKHPGLAQSGEAAEVSAPINAGQGCSQPCWNKWPLHVPCPVKMGRQPLGKQNEDSFL